MNRIGKWTALYEKTNEMTKPGSIDQVLSVDELKNIEKSIVHVLNRFFDRGELHKGIKIYVDKILRNDFVDIMVSNRPQENESLEDWGNKIFGNKKFGVVFNSIESYDNTIAELMCSIITPLIQKAGLPLGGLSFLFFMGNYGFTPFGIHKEAKGEDGFLFHIGPEPKEFYTWDTEELNKIPHNTVVYHEEKDMLPSSKKYILNPSSVMFIPHQIYHIGNTKEFSLSVVMDYINPSKDYLEKELAKEISDQDIFANGDEPYLEPIQTRNNSVSLELYLDSKSITKRFRHALERKILRLKSNGGVLRPSIINNKKRIPNGEFAIQGKAVFPLYIIKVRDGINLILARGNEIPLKSHQKLKLILLKLNKGETLTFQNLKEYLLPDWDLVDIFSFASELIRIEAIDIIEIKSTTNV